MKNKTDWPDRISDLLTKELLGIQTKAEEEELQSLCRQYQMKRPGDKSVVEGVEDACRQDWEQGWKHFCHKTRRRRVGKWWQVAAMLLFFLGSGIFLYVRMKEGAGMEQVAAVLQIQPVHPKAIITLADGGQVELGGKMQQLMEANGTQLQAKEGELVYAGGKDSGGLLYNTITIPRGGEYRLILSDGTKVWMNAGSVLKFPVHFQGEMRKVFLQGEAYFEVAKQEGRTFAVVSSKGEIRVWGTSFNVRDYAEENKVVTTLEEGKISYVPASGNGEVFIQPGYMLEDRGSGKLIPVKVNTAHYCGWKDGKYIFEDLSLEEIMNTLEKWYDADVVYQNEECKKLHFTGDLMRYENIDIILNFIETGGDVCFEIYGKTILIKEK